jgi:hypothetical protein
VANVAGPVIAEEIIEPGERAGNVLSGVAVNDVDSLASVGVVKQQAMILALQWS